MPQVRRRAAALLVAPLLAAALATVPATPVAADPAPGAPVVHRAPASAPVTDPFRPGAHRYAPQNLGLEYGTTPGAPVVVSAAGQVAFAGRTPQGLWVTVAHADGLRTSYGPLADLRVGAGQGVGEGALVGTAAGRLHFSVRLGDVYLDPGLVLSGFVAEVRLRLVPAPLRPGVHDELGDHLLDDDGGWSLGRAVGAAGRVVVAGGRVVGVAVQGAADRVVTRALTAVELIVAVGEVMVSLAEVATGQRFAWALWEWWDQRDECTPPEAAVPPPGPDRADHLVVLVAGFGSSGAPGAAIDDVDVVALGYDPARVARFSYAGGIVPDPTDGEVFAGIDVHGYTAADSQAHVDGAAERLRALLVELARRHPGVAVDVIAHSQGGVVAVRAVQDRGGTVGPLPDDLSVVTIGSPHAGSSAAGAGGLVEGRGGSGELVLDVAEALPGPLGGLGHDTDAARDLRPTSSFMRDYRRHTWPPGVDVTTVAGSSDPLVPSPDTRLDGATRVVVDSGANPLTAHAGLPGRGSVTREIALAVAGLDPTCRSLLSSMVDYGLGAAYTQLWDRAGLLAAALP